MKLKSCLQIFLVIILIWPLQIAQSTEWIPVDVTYPGSMRDFTTILPFNGKIVGVFTDGTYATVYSSDDSKQWQIADGLPRGVNRKTALGIHNGLLYFFAVVPSTPEKRVLYRSSDGSNWVTIYEDDKVEGPDGHFCSYQDHLYILVGSHTLLRIKDGPSVDVESIVFPDKPGSALYAFNSCLEFNGYLYVLTQNFGFNFFLSRSMDGITWESVSDIKLADLPSTYNVGMAAYNNQLYLNAVKLLRTDGKKVPHEWTEELNLNLESPILLPIEDRLHIWSGNRPVNVKLKSGWKLGSKISSTNTREICAPVHLGKKIFMAVGGKFWFLEPGLKNITNLGVPALDLVQGQSDRELLGMLIDANILERFRCTVRNLGTATHKHFDKVQLVRKVNSTESTVLATLRPDSNDERTWTMDNFVEVEDGDTLTINATVKTGVAISASEVPTAIFSIGPGDVQTEKNTAFALSGPLVGFPLKIQAPAAASGSERISEIVISPTPAHDLVTFVYTLDSQADVTIKIFDRKGQLVSEIDDPGKPAGLRAQTIWDASHKAPGVYYATTEIKSTTGEVRRYKNKIFKK